MNETLIIIGAIILAGLILMCVVIVILTKMNKKSEEVRKHVDACFFLRSSISL